MHLWEKRFCTGFFLFFEDEAAETINSKSFGEVLSSPINVYIISSVFHLCSHLRLMHSPLKSACTKVLIGMVRYSRHFWVTNTANMPWWQCDSFRYGNIFWPESPLHQYNFYKILAVICPKLSSMLTIGHLYFFAYYLHYVL